MPLEQPLESVRVRVLPDGRMDADNASRYLGWSTATLANRRSLGLAPKFVRVGRSIFYFQADLDAFVNGGDRTA